MLKLIKRLKLSSLLGGLALALILLNVACSGSDNEPTVLVGQSRIKLIPYPLPRFKLIDDSNGQAYRAAEKVLGGPSSRRLLALYADDQTWNNFVGGITPDGPQNMFEYVAQIITDDERVDKTISLAQFNEATKKMEQAFAADGDEIIETGSRSLTFMGMTQLEGGIELKILTTYILVEGKMLVLETICLSGSRFEDQFQSASLAWRDAYLEKTKP